MVILFTQGKLDISYVSKDLATFWKDNLSADKTTSTWLDLSFKICPKKGNKSNIHPLGCEVGFITVKFEILIIVTLLKLKR